MGRTIITLLVVVLLLVVAGAGGYLFLHQALAPLPAAQATEQPAKAEQSVAAEQPEPAESAPEPAVKAPLLNGTAEDDSLIGTEGDDRLYAADESAAQGQDTVDAGPGNDRIYADASDTIQGGDGHDELVVRGTEGFTLTLAGSGIEETWGGDGDDVFDGAGVSVSLTLRGGRGDDIIGGGSADDQLYGGDGADTLTGGPGNDILKGEVGTDTLTGGPGADVFSYTAYDGSTDVITDYNFSEGDTVTAASFAIRGSDTVLLDGDGRSLFVIEDYDATAKGVARRK